MFIVDEEDYYRKGVGHIHGRFDTLKEARKEAYKWVSCKNCINIYDDSMVKPIVFIPTGQKLKNTLGEKIAEVHKGSRTWCEDTIYYYPEYKSQYYMKRNATHQRYILHKDGSLGQGM